MKEEIKIGKKYKHFKGKDYRVICIAKDCENPEKILVVYESEENQIWVREINDFLGTKIIKGKEIKRFELIE